MEFCPASMTGKTLSPKHFMEGLRDQIVAAETALAAAAGAQRAAKGGAAGGVEASDSSLSLARERAVEALSLPLVDHAIPEEAVWQCTTCGWCVEGCPVLIEHVDSIVEIRRNLVLEESRFPKELNAAFRNMETAGNPWGQPRSARLDWAKGMDVPVLGAEAADGATAAAHRGVLYWVGCAGAFDDRNRKVVRAMAALLKQADVPFAVLGPRETCTGDPARRAGNEYLFQMLAEENVATLTMAHDEHSVRTIVASCPHCFNTIRNEYPQFGLSGIEVIHHTQLLDTLVADGRLTPDRSNEAVVAYHDACYLGRYNEVYDEGRRVVEAVPGQSVVEMEQHHRKGLCCGAGGARMWMEEREGQRINHRRTEQALATSPSAIATACPFCLVMLRDGVTDLDRADVAVRDVAELLADATGAWALAGARSTAEPRIPQDLAVTAPAASERRSASIGPHEGGTCGRRRTSGGRSRPRQGDRRARGGGVSSAHAAQRRAACARPAVDAARRRQLVPDLRPVSALHQRGARLPDVGRRRQRVPRLRHGARRAGRRPFAPRLRGGDPAARRHRHRLHLPDRGADPRRRGAEATLPRRPGPLQQLGHRGDHGRHPRRPWLHRPREDHQVRGRLSRPSRRRADQHPAAARPIGDVEAPNSVPTSAGIPRSRIAETIVAPFNQPEIVERILRAPPRRDRRDHRRGGAVQHRRRAARARASWSGCASWPPPTARSSSSTR